MIRIVGAAMLLSLALAQPAFAQAAINEPGLYAFYHPDGDVLRAAPSPNAFASSRAAPSDALAEMRMSVRPHRHGHAAARE